MQSDIRNLDGIKIRGKVMNVSLSKYDRHSLLWPSQEGHEENRASKIVGKEKGSMGVPKDGRSFKEVLEGKSLKRSIGDDKKEAKIKMVDNLGDSCRCRELDKFYLEGMVWRLIEEVLCLANLEEVKQKLKLVVANSLNSLAC